MDFERRLVEGEVELRSDGKNPVIEGYASVFGAVSQNMGGFVETVNRGAFTKTIKEADVRAFFNHDKNLLLGRVGAGTLQVAEDTKGLHYRIFPGNQTYARDLIESIERDDVNQSSFGFRVVGPNGEGWGYTERGIPLRSLNEVALFDVSPVVTPAYLDSTSGLTSRSLEKLCELRGYDYEDIKRLPQDEQAKALLEDSGIVQVRSLALPDSEPLVIVHALETVLGDLRDALGAEDLPEALALATAADLTLETLVAAYGADAGATGEPETGGSSTDDSEAHRADDGADEAGEVVSLSVARAKLQMSAKPSWAA